MENESIEAESMDDEHENEVQGAVNNNLSIDNMDIDLDELDFNFEEEGEGEREVEGEGEGEAEGEGEEENDEDEEDEEEYTLHFQGEMDPLAFAQNDQSGAQPYEQFQRLEYETLAARKRKQHQLDGDDHTKKAMQKDLFGASMDEILEAANYGLGRREHKRRSKKSGRRRGEGPKLTPEVTRKLGEANLLYATGHYDQAVDLLQDVIRLIPNVPDPYHTLALVYIALGDKTKAINFYMIAAHLTPKDSLLWKRLASYSMEQGNTGQLIYCLTKAVKADPDDMAIKWDRASLYVDLNDYHRAAEAFDQIAAYRPSDVEAWKMAAKMHHRSGHSQRAREVLEKLIDEHPSEADLTVVNLLAALHMENKTFSRAIQHIEHARMIYCSGQGLPPELAIKAGICHAHLGNLEEAEKFFEDLHAEQAEELAESIIDVADAYTSIGHHHRALKYYCMLEGTTQFENAHVWLKVAQCHAAIDAYSDAIKFYYKAVDGMPDNVDVRLTLVSLLVEHDRTDEAIQLLLPPQHIEQTSNDTSITDWHPWWSNGKVKKKLAEIYQAQGKVELFVEAIASPIKETLYLETLNQKVAETHFASHTIVLRRLVKVKEALKHMVISPQWGVWKNFNTARAINVRRMILDEDWWGLVSYVLEITDPIMAMLRFADNDEPCLGDICDSMDSMLEKIKMVIQRRENDPEDTLYKKVEKVVHHQWNKMTTPLHLLAYALSPRYYSVVVLCLPGRVPPFRDVEVADGYKKALAKIFQDPEIGAIVRSEFAAFNSGEDFHPINIADRSRMGVVKWWYLHGQSFTYLQPLAIKVLSQVRMKNKLPKSVLSERVKWLDDNHVDNVFRGFRPILSSSDMNKALRARRRLAKLASRKEEKKAAALAAGLEWQSDSDDEELPEPVIKEPPLPDLLKDEEHYQLIIEICKALASLKRYWEALEIINHSLKLGHNHFCQEKQDELRSLGAQVAYNTTDPKNGYDCARYIVQQHPYSIGAWNCYYKVVSRLESRVGKHGKFMLAMRAKYPDCVPPMVICGHQFAMISQSQGALREYLEAYKTQPDNPLINLCVGTSFINLALGFRVNNRNQCVVQGFAFLYNYQRLCKNNQESNYNLARAYQHVGLVHLAVLYYEKVLAHYEKDHPIPKLPHEDTCFVSEIEPKLENYGHCDLGREAAYNLHLIYKNSGAVDLARQVLKDYCKI